MTRRISLGTSLLGALLLLTPSVHAQDVGRVFDPQVNPTDADIIAFERAFEGARTLTFMNRETGRMQSVDGGAVDAESVDLFDFGADVSAGSDYSGELTWGPRDNQGRQWFAYVSGKESGGLGLYVDYLDPSGDLSSDEPGMLEFDGPVSSPRFAPNGRHIAFASAGSIRVIRDVRPLLSGRGTVRVETLVSSSENAIDPAWSPDSDLLAYSAVDGDQRNISVISVSDAGSGGRNVTASLRNGDEVRPSFSLDGSMIAFYAGGTGDAVQLDIGIVALQFTQNGDLFGGSIMSGSSARIASDVVPHDTRGPVWLEGGQGPALTYIANDDARQSPIEIALVDPWTNRSIDYAQDITDQLGGTIQNTSLSVGLTESGVIRYVWAAQEGTGDVVQTVTRPARGQTAMNWPSISIDRVDRTADQQMEQASAGSSSMSRGAANSRIKWSYLIPGLGHALVDDPKAKLFLGTGIPLIAAGAFFVYDIETSRGNPDKSISDFTRNFATPLFGVGVALYIWNVIDARGKASGGSMSFQATPSGSPVPGAWDFGFRIRR